MAKAACDRGKVLLNGTATKASRALSPGDRIRVELGVRVLEVEVLDLPAGRPSRKQAPGFYRILEGHTPVSGT
jgi:ribosomal 50S subunit-recycling heat shock protein